MAAEWIRFGLCAAFTLAGLFCFIVGVMGVNTFDFVLNRMHAAGICDTLGTLLVILGLVIAKGADWYSLKLLLVLALLWVSSPVSTHMLSWLERRTSAHLAEYIKNEEEDGHGSV